MKKYLLLACLFVLTFSISNIKAQGCMDDDGGSAGVKVFGFIQPQADYKILDRDGFGGDKNEYGFYFERARLGVMGSIPYDFSYYFVTEMAPIQNKANGYAASICDAFITYKRFAPYLKVSVGQFKTQISAEQLQGCHKLYTVYRSLPVNSIAGPVRDMGLMVSGSIDTLLGSNLKDLIGYTFGYMNGTGRNILENNLKKDFTARLTIKPFDFVTLGLDYRSSKSTIENNDGTSSDASRVNYGADLTFEYKNFFLQGEYLFANDEGKSIVGGGCGGDPVITDASDKSGFYVMAAYMTPWHLQPVIKYESYDPDIDNVGTASSYAQNIATFGLNYFFNEKTRVQLNYLYKAEETGDIEFPNDELVLQFQVVF